ncbi:MAG: hypothetical protein ABIS50_22500 [Luteolibacter sp.]|uniref:hypothetical protein n=1 Tax=Luteolibacter sp. TaxID=1962973 RepID=UPI0032637CBD
MGKLHDLYQNFFGSIECRGCGDQLAGRHIHEFLPDGSAICIKCWANGVVGSAFEGDLLAEESEELEELGFANLEDYMNGTEDGSNCVECGAFMVEASGVCPVCQATKSVDDAGDGAKPIDCHVCGDELTAFEIETLSSVGYACCAECDPREDYEPEDEERHW